MNLAAKSVAIDRDSRGPGNGNAVVYSHGRYEKVIPIIPGRQELAESCFPDFIVDCYVNRTWVCILAFVERRRSGGGTVGSQRLF